MNRNKLKRKRRMILLFAFAAMLAAISASIITYGAESEEFVRPDLIPYIEKVSADYGVSPELIEAVIETESQGISTAQNGSCIGLMQVSTRWHMNRAAALGVDMTTDKGNILTGTDFLMEIAAEEEDIYYVLATYNGQRSAAPGKSSEYAEKILNRAEELEKVHGKRKYEQR